jgi:lysylphosphatidylglycerol synthetase-like protein (DUF2156 family)
MSVILTTFSGQFLKRILKFVLVSFYCFLFFSLSFLFISFFPSPSCWYNYLRVSPCIFWLLLIALFFSSHFNMHILVSSPLYFPLMCLSTFLSDLHRYSAYKMTTNILSFVFSVRRFKSVTELQFSYSLHTLNFAANYQSIRMDTTSPPQTASCPRRCVFHTTQPYKFSY